jgi:hypothetical protein
MTTKNVVNVTNGKRILSVNIIRELDTDPDTSWLGEYSNRPKSDYAIDRARDCGGDRLGRNEYRYFNPCHENYMGEPEADIRKYCLQDFNRMESLQAGEWHFLGIRAQATVVTGSDSNHSLTQRITSGGVWGIESDSGKDTFAEVETEQLAELKDELKALGFSARAISKAFKTIDHEER